jgi:hypothetical protein
LLRRACPASPPAVEVEGATPKPSSDLTAPSDGQVHRRRDRPVRVIITPVGARLEFYLKHYRRTVYPDSDMLNS